MTDLQESSTRSRLWACHGHMMIGNQQEAHGHRMALGCEVEELDQETSDAIRELWRKQQYDRVGALIVHAGRVPREETP